MRSFQKKRGFRNIIYSRPILLFLVILILFFAWNMLGFMNKMSVTRENRKIAENKVAQLEKEKEKLASDINKLKSQNGIEENIRDKFGLAKEGEGLIVILDDKNTAETSKENSGGFFSFLKNWFEN
ncbi:hypothetical protein A2641_02510 [Candidatus Nomurabacteria bacterium RIFCSPHIGHO2_01_FULL_37_25]|uniref:Septum formation initiator n=1 Tax=Candidatus Nomurabacteria bacterium RIFCSPLOWO2_01_FULL_36_16 TaxID=1801767 RepID=A0A1F6X069_9BACT|nr:MAG: hypothetical protein A2641_02510 [Candidatus Nomurabacteria bacterium RIFCSPHIGHO2_01_FULL_37_25]OGI75028.1 MAG: hypothetical protein A3D36_03255 [Candidatus Nomurabacteria bacterium RIFCSPHIGHO2_02_FULL_36_29]OGI87539.1 MAG: hypothetical protein A3A91_01325 [Candidatus Nomurabacteria bacterium RIFCSPLOWO2_01_FULL_36_16]OGI96770.1 MAG: hypothetical protein A3I84_02330 [Candidatus Nomurabacteria bacterium RIFCSPLOWO2_02_FULL_36_8]